MAEYIDREKILEHIKDLPTWWADDKGMYAKKYPDGMFDCEDVIASIENAPAADVAPVIHAIWKIKYGKEQRGDFTAGEHNTYYCSNCGLSGNPFDKYCKECGAKMRR